MLVTTKAQRTIARRLASGPIHRAYVIGNAESEACGRRSSRSDARPRLHRGTSVPPGHIRQVIKLLVEVVQRRLLFCHACPGTWMHTTSRKLRVYLGRLTSPPRCAFDDWMFSR